MGLICSALVASGAESKVARAKRFKILGCTTLFCGAVGVGLNIAMHVYIEDLAVACANECGEQGQDKRHNCLEACPSLSTVWIAWLFPFVGAL
jgi:hypothetical protein